MTEETAARQAAQQGAGPSPGAVAADPATRDRVRVSMPAEGAYLSVLRTATAGLAARLDFTLDEIEDLRIAVDEACAMLLPQAVPGAEIKCEFSLDSDTIAVSVSVFTLSRWTSSCLRISLKLDPDKELFPCACTAEAAIKHHPIANCAIPIPDLKRPSPRLFNWQSEIGNRKFFLIWSPSPCANRVS